MLWLVRIWIPLAIAVTGLSGLIYVSVHQNYRQSLNDPQIQMAESAAFMLADGEIHSSVGAVVPKAAINIEIELTPWLAVYDSSRKLLGSSGILTKEDLHPPAGVFDAAKNNAGKGTDRPYENRVTWQPELGIRQALVVVYVPERDLYVVAGRSMREVEMREWQLERMVGLGWLLILFATLVVCWIGGRMSGPISAVVW